MNLPNADALEQSIPKSWKYQSLLMPIVILVLLTCGCGAVLANEVSRLENFSWRGDAVATSLYDSNFDHLGVKAEPDLAVGVAPLLTLAYNRSTIGLSNTFAYTWQQYLGLSKNANKINRQTFDEKANVDFRFRSGLSLSFQYLYLDTDEPEFSALEGRRELVHRYRYGGSTRISQSLAANRLDLSFSYRYQKDGYLDFQLSNLSSVLHSGLVEMYYQIFPKTSLFGDFNVTARLPVVSNALVDRNYKSYKLNLGVQQQWTKRLEFKVRLGSSYWRFSNENNFAPTILLDVVFRPNSISEFAATYGYQLLESTTSLYFKNHRSMITAIRQISRSFKGTLVVGYDYLIYSAPYLRKDHVFRNKAGLTFKPVALQMFDFSANYSFERRISDSDFFDPVKQKTINSGFLSHVIGLDAAWHF